MPNNGVASQIQPSGKDDPWYAVYTRHQHEKTVVRALANKGFNTLLPLYRTARRWKQRTTVLSLPLFPCYVFFKGDVERRLDILTTPGVHGVVSNRGRAAPIPADEMEAIRRGLEGDAQFEPYPFLNNGDRVRIKSGALEGLEGILLWKRGLCRVVVSIELLGRSAAVTVRPFDVERVNRGTSSHGLCPPIPRSVSSEQTL